MKSFNHSLTKIVLRRVVSRACQATIPRSGEEGEKVNCFVTAIDKGDDPYLVVLNVVADELQCIEWDGSKYQIERKLPIAEFEPAAFRITHYYGLSTIAYTGIFDFVLGRVFAWPYLKIHVARRLSALDQYLFNKKKLISKQRTELLKLLVERAQQGHSEHEPLDLMTELYSIKWVVHPQGNSEQQRLEFYLDSLVETGELRKMNYKYVVTGFALRAIEEYEEQERKHTENVKMQWRAFWVAVAVAALTLVQAGLIRLPTIIDFTP